MEQNNAQLTPEVFKQKILTKYPDGVASDGTPYSKMDATELTRRVVQQHPDGVTSDGHKYSDYLPKSITQPQPDIASTEPEPEKTLGEELVGRVSAGGKALTDTITGKINPISGLIQTGGAVAGGINDVVTKGLEMIPFVKQAEGLIGKGVGKLAETKAGQAVATGIQNFSEKHPELAADIAAIANIVGAVGTFYGAGAAKNVVGKALGKSAIEKITADIVPEVSARVGAKQVAKQGLIKTAIKGEIVPVADKAVKDVAQVVADNVPYYTKLKTFTDKLNATRATVYSMADKLKKAVEASGKDIIYPFKELESNIKKIDMPIAIKADKVLGRQFDLAREAALKISKDQGGTISSLFEARKLFDDLVAKQFPTLYDRANAPMRDAITSVRRAMNDFIESKLPDGIGFKDSLRIQSKLFDAIDSLAPKAYGEIGTTRFSRFTGKHPVISGLIKQGAKGAAVTAGGGTLYGAYRGLTGD